MVSRLANAFFAKWRPSCRPGAHGKPAVCNAARDGEHRAGRVEITELQAIFGQLIEMRCFIFRTAIATEVTST